jgi:hypothetical protein
MQVSRIHSLWFRDTTKEWVVEWDWQDKQLGACKGARWSAKTKVRCIQEANAYRRHQQRDFLLIRRKNLT